MHPSGRRKAVSASVRTLAVLAFLAAVPSRAQDNRPPVPEGPPTYLPATVYVGDTVRLAVKATDPDGEALTYSWNFGDNTGALATGTVPEASHVFTSPGRYPVLVRIRDAVSAVTASVLVAVHLKATAVKPTASSSIILDPARDRVWCVNADNHSVSAMDAATLSLLFEMPTGLNPHSLALAPDGTVWVANSGSSTLSILSGEGQVIAVTALPYGSRPHGIAISPDGKAAYVALEASGKLARLDPATRRVTAEVAVGPSPRHIAITADNRILVARFLSPDKDAEVYEVDPSSFTKVRTIPLAEDFSPDDETGGAGVLNYLGSMAVAPTGREAIVPASKENVRRGQLLNNLPLSFENTVRTVSTRLNLLDNKEDPTTRNDIDNASLASAAAFSPLGDLFFLALMGTNSVHIMDPYNNGSVLERIPDVGAAPRGLAVDGTRKRLYVQNFLGRDIAVYDIADVLGNVKYVSNRVKAVPTVIKEALDPQVLRGKKIFYHAGDSAMSKDGYLSCASCHLDGATDGRVWDFTDRGEGLRRTTSLLGRAGMGHGPVHWSANFDEIQDFEHDIRGPFGGRGFMQDADFTAGTRNTTLGDRKSGLSEDLDALAAYVASLTRVNPSPFRNADGNMTADATAGEAIFKSTEAGCAKCHAGPRFTDSELSPTDFTFGIRALPGNFRLHDVGTLKPSSGKRLNDTLKGIDTPTLLGVWETGPYLHDGSAATLMDVITTANPGDKHGKTSHLSAGEKAQLVAFLQQLDQGPGPVVGIRPGQRLASGAPALRVSRAAGGAARFTLTGWAGLEAPTVAIRDGKGRKVAALTGPALRREADGVWVGTWNGTAASGGRAAPGIYLVEAKTAGLKVTAKLPWSP